MTYLTSSEKNDQYIHSAWAEKNQFTDLIFKLMYCTWACDTFGQTHSKLDSTG